MARERYKLQFGVQEGKDWNPVEVIESEDLPLRIGSHDVFELIVPTPQGHKRVTVTAKVEKYR